MTFGVGLPDIEYSAGERPRRVRSEHAAPDQENSPRFKRRRHLAPERGILAVIRTQYLGKRDGGLRLKLRAVVRGPRAKKFQLAVKIRGLRGGLSLLGQYQLVAAG